MNFEYQLKNAHAQWGPAIESVLSGNQNQSTDSGDGEFDLRWGHCQLIL